MAERYKDIEIIVIEPEKVIDILEQEITKEDYDLDYIKDLATYGAFDIDSVLSDGETLLMKAKYKWDIVSVLLEAGADPNAQDSFGMTAIKRAVMVGGREISFREILKHPLTNPNIQDSERWTALMNGTSENKIRMVRELLKHPNIDLNLQNEEGKTALMMASEKGHSQVVRELLKHPNIDLNLQDSNGDTALMLVLMHGGHSQVVQALLEHPNINVLLTRYDNRTAWDLAKPEIRKQFPELNPIEYIIKAKDKEIEELKSLIEELKSKSKKSKKVS
jgi:ankyrin repeat protein